MFGGGVAAIETVHDVVINRKLPVLIVPFSGGAAEVLTEAIEASRRSDDIEYGYVFMFPLFGIKLQAEIPFLTYHL